MVVRVRIDEHNEGWGEYVRSSIFVEQLRLKAEEFVGVAKGVYMDRQVGESEPPTFYMQSFYIRIEPWQVEGGGPGGAKQPGYAYRVGNLDDIANLVEFGSHAGEDHETPVLGYRVFGRTMDIMGAG